MSLPETAEKAREKEQQRRSRNVFIAALVILAVLLILAGPGLWQALSPVWLAAALAYALFPVVRALEKKFSRTLSVSIVLALLVAVFVAAIVWLIPLAVKQAGDLVQNMPGYIRQVKGSLFRWQQWLDKNAIPVNLVAVLDDAAKNAGSYIAGLLPHAAGAASALVSAFVVILLTPLYIFYYLKERERFINGILYYVPFHIRPLIRSIGHRIHVVLGRFLRAQLLIAVITAVLITAAYFIVGQSYAILFGFVMGVFSLFPYIGPVLGAIPPIIVSLLAGNMQWLPTLLAIVVVQQLIGTVIAPRILGKEVDLHPVHILTAILAGAYVAGLWGALFAIPVALILLAIIREIFTYTIQIRHHPR
ncbi:MAG: AI-2E family transporter [Clostridiales bacterium]|jgi:predicted PurR-regulated permease PerM|nr:AI-2E family transporter [Clostridiales bacterium]